MGQAKELVDRVWAAIEAGDLGPLDDLLTADVEQVGPGWDLRGVEATRGLLAAYLAAFPDLRHEVVAWAETGESVAVELRLSGTHTGPLQTPDGGVAPTGRSIVIRSCDMITVRAGRVSSWRAYFDQLNFMGQLGLVPVPAG